MATPDPLPLDQQMLRGAGIWQGLIALPICLYLGAEAFQIMLESWRSGVYYFMYF